MDALNTVAELCRMPLDFFARRNVSMLQLLKESGYFEAADEISVQAIQDYFAAHQELVQAWYLASIDTRGSPHWYILSPLDRENRSGKWVVGAFPGNEPQQFEYPWQACAIYVAKTAEHLRQVANGG